MASSDRDRPWLRGLTAAHSLPLFEGRKSRRHQEVALWKLWALAHSHRVLARSRFSAVETFVQFAGFPRSGHSLIGSILDAHPQARVSHELDATGLLKEGFSQASIFALIDKKSIEFTRHGRFWNGYCYLVPEGYHNEASDLRVLGDKKGDAAVRWIAQDPSLLVKLRDERRVAKKWILVLRNPFDNIATMSLRKGRAYDELKTNSYNQEEFQQELKIQQDKGIIAREALGCQIDDYASLCETIARIKQATPTSSWFELCHEDLAAQPETVIEAMLSFLELSNDRSYVKICASLVNKHPNPSRYQLRWSKAQRVRIHSLIREFSFLNRYGKDDDAQRM